MRDETNVVNSTDKICLTKVCNRDKLNISLAVVYDVVTDPENICRAVGIPLLSSVHAEIYAVYV